MCGLVLNNSIDSVHQCIISAFLELCLNTEIIQNQISVETANTFAILGLYLVQLRTVILYFKYYK